MNSSEYQVTIKSANQKVDDYVTKCRPTWTVHRLKQHISETHISKPSIEDQRLIYAGNLLKDSHTLKQIFFRDSLCTELTNSSKTDFTIHLVCQTQIQKIVNGPHAQAASNSQSSTRAPPPQSTPTVPTPVPAAQPPSPLLSAPTSSSTSGQDINLTRPNARNATSSSSAQNQQQQAPINGTPIRRLFSNLNYPVGQSSTTALNETQQAELVQNLMHSEQMRQQLEIFQQLAYLVAAQIANSVDMNSNLVNNNPIAASANTIDQAIQVPGFVPVLNGQALNVQITASSSGNNHITTTASQMLYAGNRQQTQFVQADTHEARAEVNQNDNLNNENNVNNQGEPAAAHLGYGGQMQAQPPVVEQPAPQPADPEVAMLEHDVIDWVYYSIRAFVLMAALYIHASMFRLLFLVGLLAVAYFFNRRSTRRVAPRQQEPQRQPGAAQEVNVGGVAADNNRQGAQDGPELRRRNGDQEGAQQVINDNNNNEANNRDRAQADEVVHARVPFFKLCYLVVTDFLASLVPE